MGAWTKPLSTNISVRLRTSGAVNTTLYTGDIEFIDMPIDNPTYWILPLTSLFNSAYDPCSFC